jgi:hypothetical protein
MCRACDAGVDWDDPVSAQQYLDQENAWLRETIRTQGWAYIGVQPEGPTDPGFTYTVGLWGFEHPELVVYGLSFGVAQELLKALAERVRGGSVFADGDEVRSVVPAVRLLDLPNAHRVIHIAQNLYRTPYGRVVPALQVCYPDDFGAFPWEPTYRLPSWRQPMPEPFCE